MIDDPTTVLLAGSSEMSTRAESGQTRHLRRVNPQGEGRADRVFSIRSFDFLSLLRWPFHIPFLYIQDQRGSTFEVEYPAMGIKGTIDGVVCRIEKVG